jgi:galactose-1-phosphate uridylyltransferase
LKIRKHKWIERLKDGTVKQLNPFTGTEVWSVPERAARPLANVAAREPRLLEPRFPEDYCSFCEGLQKETTPERARMVRTGNKFKILSYVPPKESLNQPAEFRRISNLFEIVSYDYWQKNYGFTLSSERRQWKEAYLADPSGSRHVKDILETKYRSQGRSEEWLGRNFWNEWKELSDSLFGGSHDLVIARRHYFKGACFETDLASSGELTPEEHFQFIQFTLSGIQDIYANNPHVKYASVFQNWLSPAGASFNHLHKQIVGLDEWGVLIGKIMRLLQKTPQAFNEYYLNYCLEEELVVAENPNAVCVASFGERFPTLAVFSKARGVSPWELTTEEIRDFSDLLQGIHAALGTDAPCNEEWFFTPRDASFRIPWHVLLKWRLNTPAGFEGNTEIYINTVEPRILKERITASLLKAREKKKTSLLLIGEECRLKPDSLRYNT